MNSRRMVLDTSVVVKWIRQGEVLAEHALALRNDYLSGRLTVILPTLLAYELANVLRYKLDMTTSQVQDAMQSVLDLGMDWVPLSPAWMQRAIDIARTHDVTVYDAYFVAVAEALRADFTTADERLTQRLTGFAFVHFLGRDDWRQ